nr:MAG TPA: hypothetical protein [Caudoviricetes sp.]
MYYRNSVSLHRVNNLTSGQRYEKRPRITKIKN